MISVHPGVDRAALVLDAVVGAYGQATQALGLVVLHVEVGVGEGGDFRARVEGVVPALGGSWVLAGNR